MLKLIDEISMHSVSSRLHVLALKRRHADESINLISEPAERPHAVLKKPFLVSDKLNN